MVPHSPKEDRGQSGEKTGRQLDRSRCWGSAEDVAVAHSKSHARPHTLGRFPPPSLTCGAQHSSDRCSPASRSDCSLNQPFDVCAQIDAAGYSVSLDRNAFPRRRLGCDLYELRCYDHAAEHTGEGGRAAPCSPSRADMRPPRPARRRQARAARGRAGTTTLSLPSSLIPEPRAPSPRASKMRSIQSHVRHVCSSVQRACIFYNNYIASNGRMPELSHPITGMILHIYRSREVPRR